MRKIIKKKTLLFHARIINSSDFRAKMQLKVKRSA